MADAFLPTPWTQPAACYAVLVEGPEPVLSLHQGKLLAGATWAPGDPREELLSDFIRAAAQKVELDTGLALLEQTRDVYFAIPEDGYVPLPSQCTPTISVEDVTAPEARARGWSLQQRISRAAIVAPPGFTGVLRVTAGWSSPDALRTEAPLLYHAVGLLVAHYATLGRDLAVTGAVASVNIIPEGYEAAIAPHKLIWLI